MTFRHPLLLRLAAKAPHCMLCGARNEGQVVSAHSNQQRDGKGASLKASDAAIAFLCWTCHGRVDQGNEPKAVKIDLWEQGHRATMRWLVESGHFIVSPVPTPPPVIEAKPKKPIARRKMQSGSREIPPKVDAWPKGRKLQSGKKFQSSGTARNASAKERHGLNTKSSLRSQPQ